MSILIPIIFTWCWIFSIHLWLILYSSLFEVARIIKDKKPAAFVLENVKGLVNHDKGKTINIIEKTLMELGYDIKCEILNALHHGVPKNSIIS